jgi:cob(I)alamin adenosyltransferase
MKKYSPYLSGKITLVDIKVDPWFGGVRMSVAAKKAIGIGMVCLSVFGILLSIFLLYQIWHYRQPVINGLQSGLDHASSLLQTTDEGLAVINQVISNVYTSTLYLSDATDTLAQTMQSSTSFMDSAGNFIGEDLITTITNTQTALDSAQASAAVIDNILGTISKVPFIGINYAPSTPLNTALGEVTSSLDPVQESLKNFQADLATTQTNMQSLTDQMSGLDQKIMTINKNLAQAQTTIDNYRTEVNSIKLSVANSKANLSTWITTVAAIITLIILSLVAIQIGMFLQGITLLAPERRDQEIPAEHQ